MPFLMKANSKDSPLHERKIASYSDGESSLLAQMVYSKTIVDLRLFVQKIDSLYLVLILI